MLIYLMYVLFASVLATSWMTIFSYLLSIRENRQFREPEILNDLINGASTFQVSVSRNNLAGWLIHYSIGVIFTIVFLYLYSLDFLAIDIISTLVFGIAAGFVGIIGWQLMFYLNNDPPKIFLKSFYLQLILAHLVYSLFLVGGFYFLKL